MPPQQAYGLLDFVDDILDFIAHALRSQPLKLVKIWSFA
jgi:hypothetical protein